jgi:hypothetical protein
MDGTSQEKSADPTKGWSTPLIDGALQDRPSSTPSASSSLDWRFFGRAPHHERLSKRGRCVEAHASPRGPDHVRSVSGFGHSRVATERLLDR